MLESQKRCHMTHQLDGSYGWKIMGRDAPKAAALGSAEGLGIVRSALMASFTMSIALRFFG